MMSTAKRGKVLLTAFVAVLASGLGAGRAEAQWGFGGMGIGFYGGGFVPNIQQPSNFLNQVAIAQMAHVKGPPGSNPYTSGSSPYAGNPNAYFNHVRDNGFVDQYSASARQPSYYRSPAPARARGSTPVAMTVAQARPLVPLTTFFNGQGQLAWPGDSPTADSLKEKRGVVDGVVKVVLDEVKMNGVASVASVTEARQKLLDYGRPALKYVRTHETARIADSFHGFLLELYDSLAQAANPPVATAAAGTAGSPSS
jgi:hypothetical protein